MNNNKSSHTICYPLKSKCFSMFLWIFFFNAALFRNFSAMNDTFLVFKKKKGKIQVSAYLGQGKWPFLLLTSKGFINGLYVSIVLATASLALLIYLFIFVGIIIFPVQFGEGFTIENSSLKSSLSPQKVQQQMLHRAKGKPYQIDDSKSALGRVLEFFQHSFTIQNV